MVCVLPYRCFIVTAFFICTASYVDDLYFPLNFTITIFTLVKKADWQCKTTHGLEHWFSTKIKSWSLKYVWSLSPLIHPILRRKWQHIKRFNKTGSFYLIKFWQRYIIFTKTFLKFNRWIIIETHSDGLWN